MPYFVVSNPEPQLGQAYNFQSLSKTMSLNASLETGLPGGCGPSLDRCFRNARKNPLPAPKGLLTSSMPSTLQAKLRIRTQTHLGRRKRPNV